MLFFIFLLNCKSSKYQYLQIKPQSAGIKILNIKTSGYYYSLHKMKKGDFFKKDLVKNLNDEYVYSINPLILKSNGTASLSDDVFGLFVREDCDFKPENSFVRSLLFLECFLLDIGELVTQGYFEVNDSIIRIQYEVPYMNVNDNRTRVLEKRGVILNDSTLILNKIIDYKKKRTYKINELYHFKQFVF